MLQLSDYIERAKASEYFSGARLGDDLSRFLAVQRDAARGLAELASNARRLFLVGSGGSLANLQIAGHVLDRLVPLPTETLTGYELIWRASPALDGDALAVFCSYSGDTEDTVAALHFAKECG